MSENSNPNNQLEKDSKKLGDNNNNKLNYSFSPTNNSFTKKSNQKKEKEKPIKIKKSITKGKILGGQFIIGEEVGKGTFGVVRIATHIITGEKVAVKMLFKEKIVEESDKKRLEREIKILKILRHNNIVQLYNVINTSSTIYLVMEYIKGKELFEIIVHKKKLSELDSLRYYQQLISGIEYLGKIRVAHRDLKPENLLIDSKNNLKIADFGLSNMYKHNELLSTACGSPCYAAPEMLAGDKYFGLSADIWSSGIILYTMLCGRLPFEDKDNEVLYKKIKEGYFTIPEFLSDNAKDFLQKVLVVDPKKRYNILQIKKHPWFNQIDQRKYMSKGLLLNKFITPIDEDIVSKMENEYEYNSKEVRLNLLGNKHNHITTTYYLILKKKIKKGINSICDMNSNGFLNYINNSKNLLSSYNGDWNKIFRERGIKNRIEKSSTFKSNSSNHKKESKKDINVNINNNREIKNNNNNNKKLFDENNISFNNKSDENFLIEKKDIENKENKTENKEKNEKENNIKTQFAFENKNNGFKEKIDEIYKQKNQNNACVNTNTNINNKDNKNTNSNTNKTSSNNINDNTITITKDKKTENFQKINNNIFNKINKNYKIEKIVPINLDEINKKIYTPSISKDLEHSLNNNIYINTISFSNNSNKKNLTSYHTKSTNSKKKLNTYKNKSSNIQKLKTRKNKNSKSAGKENKIKKKPILININKIRIDNKKLNKTLKIQNNKTNPIDLDTPNNNKNLVFHKTNPNCRNKKNIKKNNSSKVIYYQNDKHKRDNNINIKNSITYTNTNNITKKNSKFKSVNKNMIKMDINKNGRLYGNSKNNYINKIKNKIIPSFTINKDRISYNQNTNLCKKISIEGIYYAHKKSLKEINNLYNKISYQSKYKKSNNNIKKCL